MRIVSLLPSITEICYALGLGDQVVAVTHECDFPSAAASKPQITRNVLPPGITDSAEIDRLVRERVSQGLPIYELDIELLTALDPDLILTQELCPVCAVSYEDVMTIARTLPRMPRVLSIEPTSVDGVLESIHTVGAATGREGVATSVVDALRHRIDWIAQRISEVAGSPRRVVCLEWLSPLMIGGHWVPEMVTLAGGNDVLGKAGERTTIIEWDQVVTAAPDVLILMPCGNGLEHTVAEAALLRDLPNLESIPAVRHEQVYAVDGSSYFNRPGPRLVAGIEILAEIFHPEAFGGISPEHAMQAVQLLPVSSAR
ncbi:MAG TPA: cobalamin-binding protein [Nitrolancea sp.]|jgi:iron complex transport system substrate-binding protein|nr:cobalamin-binding protein [Nitrolancea sp.]